MNTRTTFLRRVPLAVAAVSAPALALTASPALAHGSMQTPVSRVLACYQENPESPRSAACKAAVAASGTQPFYDWNGVRIGEAAGRHRRLIPNGKLCSAGDPAFRGLDLPRSDWPSTKLRSGAAHTFRYKATAPHRGGFQLYITKNGYNPRKPLKWSDLESKPFLSKNQPTVKNGAYTFAGKIPAGKKGRHLIYAIWQRSDSPEAFYSCSDVVFGGSTGSAGAAKPGTKPAAKANPKPAATGRPCEPSATGHHHGGPAGGVTLNSKPAAGNGTDRPADPIGTALITGAVGLVLGGAGGLVLTGRRTRRRNI